MTGDIEFHHEPKRISDRFAARLVCTLRKLADLYFRKDYIRRSLVIETIAALPGMIGGKTQHYRALRWMRPEPGFIRTLLAEAENERMHLMAFLEIGKPNLLDRIIVVLVQFVFCVLYSLAYLGATRACHRFVGYLEEEATRSYTHFLEEIDAGRIADRPAPALAIQLWKLAENATMRDMVVAIRADEMRHRDNNHAIADQVG